MCAAAVVQDAAESFQYPDTITAVSYVLRKAYLTFLWDYEQIYYHRRSGQPCAPLTRCQKSTCSGFLAKISRLSSGA